MSFSPIFYRRITVARRSSDLARGDQLKPEGETELSGVGEAVRIRIKVNERMSESGVPLRSGLATTNVDLARLLTEWDDVLEFVHLSNTISYV